VKFNDFLTTPPIKQPPGELAPHPSMTVAAIADAGHARFFNNGVLWVALAEKAYAQSTTIVATMGTDTVRFFNN
jgi:hypothetical protein